MAGHGCLLPSTCSRLQGPASPKVIPPPNDQLLARELATKLTSSAFPFGTPLRTIPAPELALGIRGKPHCCQLSPLPVPDFLAPLHTLSLELSPGNCLCAENLREVILVADTQGVLTCASYNHWLHPFTHLFGRHAPAKGTLRESRLRYKAQTCPWNQIAWGQIPGLPPPSL